MREMNEEQRKALIPELDDYAEQAKDLKKSLYALAEHHQLYTDPTLAEISKAAANLSAALRNASDELKRRGVASIQDYALTWYGWHYEDDDPPPTCVVESVEYEGNDRWIVVMSSAEHGHRQQCRNLGASL